MRRGDGFMTSQEGSASSAHEENPHGLTGSPVATDPQTFKGLQVWPIRSNNNRAEGEKEKGRD